MCLDQGLSLQTERPFGIAYRFRLSHHVNDLSLSAKSNDAKFYTALTRQSAK